MKIHVYTFRDVKVGSYGPPQLFQNEAVLKRVMQEHFSTGRGDDLSKYPNDFDCYHIGTYDDDTGALDSDEAPVFVFNCGVLKTEFEASAH